MVLNITQWPETISPRLPALSCLLPNIYKYCLSSPPTSLLHSHWSRSNQARLSLVQSFSMLTAILCHKEPAQASEDLGALKRKKNKFIPCFPYAGSLWHKGAYNRTTIPPHHYNTMNVSTNESGEHWNVASPLLPALACLIQIVKL